MSDDVIFPNGLIFKEPRSGAPEYIKGSLSVICEEFITFLRSQSDDWVNIDLKISKSGKAYAQLNTWKPETKQSSGQPKKLNSDFSSYNAPDPGNAEKFQDNIPF